MFPLLLPDPARVDPVLLLTVALALDAAIGDPPALFRWLPHPVALLGKLIDVLERGLNRPELSDDARRARGIVAMLAAVALAAGVGVLIDRVAAEWRWSWIVEVAAIAVLIAQRSLYDHVAAVAQALETGGLAGGRDAVRHIVGRDPLSLDEHGVVRAATESLAENFSDGVVAPVVWFLVLGLPGLCAYKAINTLDSMIGHRSLRYRAFGWAAARLDDLANLIPSRLAGVLIAIAAALLPGTSGAAAMRTMAWDARRHRSPNAGWPEAAMAGALDRALAGPRRYGAETVDDPWIGAGSRASTARDIRRALRVFVVACLVEIALVAVLAVLRASA
jgi:adenosylcobinamide-phosphate synthase